MTRKVIQFLCQIFFCATLSVLIMIWAFRLHHRTYPRPPSGFPLKFRGACFLSNHILKSHPKKRVKNKRSFIIAPLITASILNAKMRTFFLFFPHYYVKNIVYINIAIFGDENQ